MKLKELLSEDLYKQVAESLGEKADKLFVGEGEFIPKQRFDEVNSQVKDYKTQVEERDKQLSEIQQKVKGNEELSAELEKVRTNNKNLEQEYQNKLIETRRNFAIESAIRSAGVRNDKALKAVKALLDQEKIKFEEDTFKGIDEQVKELKESESYLFEAATPAPGRSGLQPADPPQPNPYASYQKIR